MQTDSATSKTISETVHNILLLGPPGSGKTMMARRLPSILPPLSLEEALETTKLYSGEKYSAQNTLVRSKGRQFESCRRSHLPARSL